MITFKHQRVSLLKALAIAPLSVPVVSSAWLVLASSIGLISIDETDYLSVFLAVAMIGTGVGYIAVILFGLPLFIVLLRLKRLRSKYFVLTGFVLALVFAVGMQPFNWFSVPLIFFCSIAVSTAFGRIVACPGAESQS